MERLTRRSPATWTDCLDMGGSRAYTRKALLWQRALGDSLAICDGDELMALAFLVPDAAGRLELALSIKPQAAGRMCELRRIAHLTLTAIADTGSVIVCHVNAGNQIGARLARLVGFSHAEGTLWIFSEGNDVRARQGNIRRWQQQQGAGRSEQTGRAEPPAADCGQ